LVVTYKAGMIEVLPQQSLKQTLPLDKQKFEIEES
jgi:hypothetical protein